MNTGSRNSSLTEFFSAFFTSCYLGVRKPDRRIYQIALDVLQRDPEDVAFVDDRPENVSAAASLGIHAIRYEAPRNWPTKLTRLGISLERTARICCAPEQGQELGF